MGHAFALDQPVAEEAGDQVIVANARKLRAISENESRNDRADAEMLARLAYGLALSWRPIFR